MDHAPHAAARCSQVGLNSLVFTVTQGIPKAVGAEICTVYLCDYGKSELWSVATGSGSEFRIPIGAGLAGHVATTGETISIADCYQDPRWKGHEMDKKNGFRTRNMLVVPIGEMTDDAKPVGVLQLINKEGSESRPPGSTFGHSVRDGSDRSAGSLRERCRCLASDRESPRP